ncbi:unnamed protein product [Kuraishia capsulata CBS 1993]|uniref:Conserved oligomeric Golgi complex subunit 2 n=1 Tax=Kuraishia capsulata CBS 1993 TaxID=1382522 RepID=W6MJK2_9ASCO|nr:uncharacterized protein KUCA_T00002428001 [Kuraishia capsulata CBS 1993]CDK26456.1 unnamed protein product [Kuraishia capsulata CBS 1993]
MVEATNGVAIEPPVSHTPFNADELLEEGEDFPFPQQVTRASFNYNLDRQTDQNSSSKEFDVDHFLFSNYRYTSLDDLSSELKHLLKELDTELVNLVNTDYSDFINLGKSMDGSVDLIHSIKVDVGNYQKELQKSQSKLKNSAEIVDGVLEQKKSLGQLKYVANAALLLNDQIESAEAIFSDSTKGKVMFSVLRELTTSYVSIHKVLTKLGSSSLGSSMDILTSLNRRISALRYNYKGLLDEYLRGLDLKDEASKDEVLGLMKMYLILGEPGHFSKIMKEKKEHKITEK